MSHLHPICTLIRYRNAWPFPRSFALPQLSSHHPSLVTAQPYNCLHIPVVFIVLCAGANQKKIRQLPTRFHLQKSKEHLIKSMRYFLLILSIKTKNVRSFLIVDVAAPPIVQEHHAGRIRATVQRAGADREGQLRSGDESQRQIRQVRSHQIFPQGSDQTHEPDHTRNQQPSQTQPHQHTQIL